MLQVYTTVISSLWNMVHDVAGFNQGNHQSVLCFPIERVRYISNIVPILDLLQMKITKINCLQTNIMTDD